MEGQEHIGDLIYETMKANGIPMSNRAFIADIVSEALYKAGYRKLPKDKPPLLSDEALHEFGLWDDVPMLKVAAQAQRELDIKHYEN